MQVKLLTSVLFFFVAQSLATPNPQGDTTIIRCRRPTLLPGIMWTDITLSPFVQANMQL